MGLPHQQSGGSLFQRQLEQDALKKIITLVILGCILFSASLFGLNYLSQQLTLNRHLTFLQTTFSQVYTDMEDYLLQPTTQDIFASALQSPTPSSDLAYSISKQNAASDVRFHLMLTYPDSSICYTTFSQGDLNLHRLEYNKIVSQNGLLHQTPIYNSVYYLSGSYSEYVFSVPIYQNNLLLGTATVYLDGSDWPALFSEYQYDCILTSETGSIIYCSRDSLLPIRSTNTFRGLNDLPSTQQTTQYSTGTLSIPQGDVTLYSFLYAPADTLYLSMGLLTIVCLGAIWFYMFLRLSQSIAAKTSESVEALVDELRIIRHGDNTHVIALNTGDEFEEIAKQINRMVFSINELNQHNTDLIQLNSLIEMRNLQAQINPHFIYNTLENIKYITCSDPELAASLIQNFTNILRYSIDNSQHDVLLSQDLPYIQDYLAIQRTRFGDRFTCEMDIHPDCLRCRVPKLLLQPLLENSLKHGFRQQMELSVSVRGHCEGDYLVLTITDDGPGLEREAMEALRTSITQEAVATSHNGLQNICRRILLEYGASSGLHIDSVPGASFTVTAKLLQKENGHVPSITS